MLWEALRMNGLGSETYTGWGTLALINAGLAETKNRSRWNWFLISLLAGPIATLLIVVWKPLPARAES
jgi:hypothetical protein